MLNRNLLLALSDAQVSAHRKGLTKLGSKWMDLESTNPESHHHNTIRSLVDRGLLKLWVSGTCAHITDYGLQRLMDYREQSKGK